MFDRKRLPVVADEPDGSVAPRVHAHRRCRRRRRGALLLRRRDGGLPPQPLQGAVARRAQARARQGGEEEPGALRQEDDRLGEGAAAGRRVRLRPRPLALRRLPPLRLRVRGGEQPVARRTRRSTGSGCSRWTRSTASTSPTRTTTTRRTRCRAPGKFYMPVQCQQCRNPPCVKACPTQATWKEPDGIVVIDYDWCIGCRCCMSACPYGARHFNWATPSLPGRGAEPEPALPRQPAAAEGRRREVHLLHPAHARGALPGVRRGLPGRRAQVREPPRSGERDPPRDGDEARVRLQGGARHAPAVLLLLRDVARRPMSGVVEFVKGSARLVVTRRARVQGVDGGAPRARRDRRDRLRPPDAHGPHRDEHARPGLVGVLHRQLHVPRGRRGRGGAARHPRLRLPVEADQGGGRSWASCSRSARSPCASCSSSWTWAARIGSSTSCRSSAPPTGRARCSPGTRSS